MKEQSSYQKMKQKYENKIQELHNDIHSLVTNNKDYAYTKLKWDLKIKLENAVWAGDTTQCL